MLAHKAERLEEQLNRITPEHAKQKDTHHKLLEENDHLANQISEIAFERDEVKRILEERGLGKLLANLDGHQLGRESIFTTTPKRSEDKIRLDLI